MARGRPVGATSSAATRPRRHKNAAAPCQAILEHLAQALGEGHKSLVGDRGCRRYLQHGRATPRSIPAGVELATFDGTTLVADNSLI